MERKHDLILHAARCTLHANYLLKYLFTLHFRKSSKLISIIILGSVLLLHILASQNAHAVLSATTSNVVQGSAPYLTFDNGQTVATTYIDLLSIKLSNGDTYTPANNPSTQDKPITLPEVGQTIDDIEMFIPKTKMSINASEWLDEPYKYVRDDEGDSGLTATGTLTLRIWGRGVDITNRATPLDICKSPYTIALNQTDITLKTTYGIPNAQWYSSNHGGGVNYVGYQIQPKVTEPYACYAQPSMTYSNLIPYKNDIYHGFYDGPTTHWDRNKGFIKQDINNPASNFPTTGAHGLFFKLTVANTTASNLTYTREPSNSGIDIDISSISQDVAKIALKGPRHGADMAKANTAVPTTFTIKSGNTPIYSFKISKWFIARPGGGAYDANYCNNTYGSNYKTPGVLDYTNGNGDKWISSSTAHQNYSRAIGGGLFAEWGNVDKNVGYGTVASIYTESDFDNSAYWAAETYSKYERYIVSSTFGEPYRAGSNRDGTACMTPATP